MGLKKKKVEILQNEDQWACMYQLKWNYRGTRFVLDNCWVEHSKQKQLLFIFFLHEDDSRQFSRKNVVLTVWLIILVTTNR